MAAGYVRQPAVYIMANKMNGTIYTGVTSNLSKRIHEHKHSVTGGFTAKYDCKLLVFVESHDTMESAIRGEKQIKAGSRLKKLKLINTTNPEGRDLYDGVF